jgi:hypothetical protein
MPGELMRELAYSADKVADAEAEAWRHLSVVTSSRTTDNTLKSKVSSINVLKTRP